MENPQTAHVKMIKHRACSTVDLIFNQGKTNQLDSHIEKCQFLTLKNLLDTRQHTSPLISKFKCITKHFYILICRGSARNELSHNL